MLVNTDWFWRNHIWFSKIFGNLLKHGTLNDRPQVFRSLSLLRCKFLLASYLYPLSGFLRQFDSSPGAPSSRHPTVDVSPFNVPVIAPSSWLHGLRDLLHSHPEEGPYTTTFLVASPFQEMFETVLCELLPQIQKFAPDARECPFVDPFLCL